jgi:hypothetical protein
VKKSFLWLQKKLNSDIIIKTMKKK